MRRAYRDFLADILTHATDAIAFVGGLSAAEVAAARTAPALVTVAGAAE